MPDHPTRGRPGGQTGGAGPRPGGPGWEELPTREKIDEELEELRAAGEMRVEQECIHDAGGGRGGVLRPIIAVR